MTALDTLTERATAAEARATALQEQVRVLREAIAIYLEAYKGKPDCIDNDGYPYQSQWAADNEVRAARAFANAEEASADG